MILPWLVVSLLACGLLSWLAARWSNTLPRWISLGGVVVELVLIMALRPGLNPVAGGQHWMAVYSHVWIPAFGIQIKFAVDGMSWLLLLLTSFLGLLAILVSWKEIKTKVGFFHFNLQFTLAGITGVFISMDLFLFYFSWELMLIPMYFLISIWGQENRVYAAYKFFLFTQASGLLLFLSILGLYVLHGRQTGVYTFDYEQLLGTVMTPVMGFILMLGFSIAFLVKLATVPFHSWLPDAHTQAPTAGSLDLAGLLLKTGAYGLIRMVLPLFPVASHQFAPVALILGVISILYGAKVAFAQTDLKRMIAYISVSHMGFILVGIYAFNEMAMQGVVMQMIAHGISTGALFIIAGSLHQRIGTRDIAQMGGLWTQLPKMGGMALLFVLASLGIPGVGNFIAEWLILNGTFAAHPAITILASLGLVASTLYALRLMQKVFLGKEEKRRIIADLDGREMLMMCSLVIALVGLGLFPNAFFRLSRPSVQTVIERVNTNYIKHNKNSL